jgi:hypothetical protein
VVRELYIVVAGSALILGAPPFSVKKEGLHLVKNDSASKIVIGIYRKEEKQ